MTRVRAPAFDPDIAGADIETLRATIAAFGPAIRIENPRIRKLIREARLLDKDGAATAQSLRAVLQDLRHLASKAARGA